MAGGLLPQVCILYLPPFSYTKGREEKIRKKKKDMSNPKLWFVEDTMNLFHSWRLVFKLENLKHIHESSRRGHSIRGEI